jgi:hypothetical protein
MAYEAGSESRLSSIFRFLSRAHTRSRGRVLHFWPLSGLSPTLGLGLGREALRDPLRA